MRVRELFKIGGITQSFGGLGEHLDWHNCKVWNKTKKEDSILLHLQRASDGEEGRAYLRVDEKFKDRTEQLLRAAFIDQRMMGLTLNELSDMEFE
jgi:hypothetical protein